LHAEGRRSNSPYQHVRAIDLLAHLHHGRGGCCVGGLGIDGIQQRLLAGLCIPRHHGHAHLHVFVGVECVGRRGVDGHAQRATGVVILVGGAVGGLGLLRLALVVQRHVAHGKGFTAVLGSGQGDGAVLGQRGVFEQAGQDRVTAIGAAAGGDRAGEDAVVVGGPDRVKAVVRVSAELERQG